MKIIQMIVEAKRLVRSIIIAGFVGIALIAIVIAFVQFLAR